MSITPVTGDGQTVPAGMPAIPLGALVTGPDGTAVPGVPIAFAWAAADMRFDDTPIRIVNTGTDGVARLDGWAPQRTAGTSKIVAKSAGYASGYFTVKFVVGAPASIGIAGAWPPVRQAGAQLAMGAAVYDANHNALRGATINFATSGAGASISDAAKVSDSTGNASIRWTLGPALGAYTLTATSGSLSQTVTVRAISGPPAAIARMSGDSQIVTMNTSVRAPLTAVVTDAGGLPVPYAAVHWTPDAGSAAACNTTTDTLGTVTCPSWRLSQVGRLGITADIGTPSTRFTAVALTAPASFTVVSAPDSLQLVRTDADLPDAMVVEMRMADGTPAVGYPVSFDADGGVAYTPVAFTDATGRASTRWRTALAPHRTTLTATLDARRLVAPVRTFGPPVFIPPEGSLFPGRSHTCGAAMALEVLCWGSNSVGQAGGPIGGGDRLVPERLALLTGAGLWTAFWSLGDHSCARHVDVIGTKYDTKLFCWGLGPDGVQSYSVLTSVPLTSYQRPGLDEGLLDDAIRQRTDGALHSCVSTARSTVYCTGRNDHGQLGDGTTVDRTGPVVVSGIVSGSQAPILGESHSCVITGSGALQCWGRNDAGQLGDGTVVDRLAPASVTGGIAFTMVRAGVAHTCGITSTGSAYCWGSNAYGQLGTGSIGGGSATPQLVAGGYSFVEIAVGDHHSCSKLRNGLAYCWGRNDHGQLGDGTKTDRGAPVLLGDYHPPY